MALSGMTGFARREGAHGDWSWAVEARSVNGRNLEVRFRGPPGMDGLERTAREAGQALFQRGQVNVALTARRAEGQARVRVDTAALERLLEAGRPYVEAKRVARPRLDGLLALRGVLEFAEPDEPPQDRAALEAAVAAGLGEALEALRAARLEEGAALAGVLGALVDRIEGLVAAAEGQAAGQGPALKARLRARLAELMEGLAFSEDRLAQEAAALAARADVREELDRLGAHVAAARGLLAGEGAAGRRLDFLTQEFMREANTLCAKSASIALTETGLELKAAIDQFREQVQNVE